MIEKLLRVTLVTLDRDREATLERLRALAIMHVETTRDESPERAAAGQAAEQLRAVVQTVRETPGAAGADAGIYAQLPVEELANAAEEVLAERADHRAAREKLAVLLADLAPWGDFDPALVTRLRAAGLAVHVCACPPSQVPALPPPALVRPLFTTPATTGFLVISPTPVTQELPEIRLPEKATAALRADLETHERELARLEGEVQRLSAALPRLVAALDARGEHADLLEVRDSMTQNRRLFHLSGYVPVKREAELRAAAATHGWALRLTEPADDDHQVPTLLTMPPWLNFAMPVFNFIGIRPGYREFDITTWFMGFFAIFFAMIIGDAGYGLIFAGLTLAARAKWGKRHADVCTLLLILSLGAVVWGALTGTWFGIEKKNLPEFTGLNALVAQVGAWLHIKHEYLPTFMRGVPWLDDIQNVQWLCFLIAATHLSVAHLWKALATINSLVCLAQVGWTTIIWGNFFLAAQLIAGRAYQPAMLWLYGIGVALVILFTAPSRNVLKTVLTGFMTIINPSGGAISSFGDLLSYIRLFAVGLSGTYVAQSFNLMGGMLKGSAWGMAIAVFIVVFGHTLNMALSSLGVLVHGIRLNTLEFSGHIGVEWVGQPFRAFARRARAGAPESL